jgi:transposase
MRGDERVQDGMFSYMTLEQRVPREHPLREIRKLTDEVLRSLSAEFEALYSDLGRRSIAPEYVLRALLLQVFFSVRSERQLVEQIDYNPAVSLVRGPGYGRRGVEPCRVLEEPRPSAHVGGGAALLSPR